MSEPFKIKYRGRFPIQQKREDGTWGCRGCGGVIPKGRRTWCSRECAHRYDPAYVIAEVNKRDKFICQHCGFDCRKAKEEWWRKKHQWQMAGHKGNLTWDELQKQKPAKAEYDHIIPFSEGGLTVPENMRTLCEPCHKKRTAEWQAWKAAQRMAERDKGKPKQVEMAL